MIVNEDNVLKVKTNWTWRTCLNSSKYLICILQFPRFKEIEIEKVFNRIFTDNLQTKTKGKFK